MIATQPTRPPSLYSAKPCKNISATQQTTNSILQLLQKIITKDFFNKIGNGILRRGAEAEVLLTQQTTNSILQLLQKKITKDFFNKIGNGILRRSAEAEVTNNLFGERLDLTQMEWRRRSW